MISPARIAWIAGIVLAGTQLSGCGKAPEPAGAPERPGVAAARVQDALARIDAVDRAGPRINAVIEVNPDAASIAAGLDARTPRPDEILFGLPVLVKDNIDTADRMATTAGSLALLGSRPASDAFVVKRLRESGAVILGKANLSEWANFRSSHSTSGWSARGGLTLNPRGADRNACGSSSGSAAAVAAGIVSMAVGTETDGSVVCPASVNGVVGIKPTVGLVSRTGIIPISISQDTAGPIADNVRNAALLLQALVGRDPSDPATQAPERPANPDYLSELRADGLTGARLGVARNLAPANPEVTARLDAAIEVLRRAGAEIVDPVDLGFPKTLGDDEFTVLLYEFKDGLNRYFAGRPGGPKSLADLITFNEREREKEMPYFGQEIFLQAEAAGPLTDAAYVTARDRARQGARAAIDRALRDLQLDAIIAPTEGPAWLTDLAKGDSSTGYSSSTGPAVAGYPHITVPMGEVGGLPVGLSFMGTAWSEGALIRLAYAYEQAR